MVDKLSGYLFDNQLLDLVLQPLIEELKGIRMVLQGIDYRISELKEIMVKKM